MQVVLLCGALAGLGGTASAQQSNQAYFNEQAERQRQQAYQEQMRLGHEQAMRNAQAAQQQQQGGYSGGGGYQSYAAPAPSDSYAAFVAPAKGGDIFTTTSGGSLSAAKNKGLQSCRMAGYTDCQVIGYFGNECGTVAFSKRGSPNFIGYGPNIETAISKAITSCTKDALPGLCRIAFIPVCVGPGVVDQSNIGKTPAADLERWSARFDTRDYWGILGQSPQSGNLVFGTDYPTVAEAEKRVYTPDFCPGCKTILSFRDSCVGFAWGKRGQRFATHAIKPDPVAARRAASKSCAAAEGGQCKSMVRCSGRTYMDGYEGEEESASILDP